MLYSTLRQTLALAAFNNLALALPAGEYGYSMSTTSGECTCGTGVYGYSACRNFPAASVAGTPTSGTPWYGTIYVPPGGSKLSCPSIHSLTSVVLILQFSALSIEDTHTVGSAWTTGASLNLDITETIQAGFTDTYTYSVSNAVGQGGSTPACGGGNTDW